MILLNKLKGKKVNIYFSKDSSLDTIHNVILKNIDSNFFEVESDSSTINKIYSISSIVCVEECREPAPYYEPSTNNL
ncbi:MAG: hypothetical protein ACRCX7_12695 [Cetobacterium sp.]|uniref:hypothetical protein n=1 Tax=Cetobacterium sp. TaxID=2071632 RepID=UPI0025C354A1|nr:hypothetical protein [Cetobacterium sp.]